MVGLSDTECRGCNKSFGRLLGHISRNKICKSFYTDAEILEKQKEKKRIQKQELRQNKSDNEKGKEKEEDRQRKKIVQFGQSEIEKEKEKDEARDRMEIVRLRKSEIEKEKGKRKGQTTQEK